MFVVVAHRASVAPSQNSPKTAQSLSVGPEVATGPTEVRRSPQFPPTVPTEVGQEVEMPHDTSSPSADKRAPVHWLHDQSSAQTSVSLRWHPTSPTRREHFIWVHFRSSSSHSVVSAKTFSASRDSSLHTGWNCVLDRPPIEPSPRNRLCMDAASDGLRGLPRRARFVLRRVKPCRTPAERHRPNVSPALGGGSSAADLIDIRSVEYTIDCVGTTTASSTITVASLTKSP